MSFNSNPTGCQVQIEFMSKKQMEKFVKWFSNKGFEAFVNSKENSGQDMAECLSANDKMDWGQYMEIE